MDIYQRLKKDHEKQRSLLRQIAETSGDSSERQSLWRELSNEAEAHAAAEEQTLYAALIEKPDGQEKARHSIAEHKEASDIIEELEELDMGSGGWLQKFKKLQEKLEHHLDEEEEEIFVRARKLLDQDLEKQLVEAFDTRKQQALSG
ncbi:hemerythrin domain-containing protein [Microbulbifer sp. Q7]|uniref:hemerythrin domain-containing protein n=1 Tax=Microbulbifer sp. Q7 TaxID=1785091 RepID=UPI0008336D1D|nr:hemerythrin domain-containing protein [Microbulbifer sp. Q7]